MTKIFGANWKTSLSGLIAVAATTIASQPNLIAFLPDDIEGWVRGIAGVIAAISAAYFALKAKDKNVTGGTVQQTAAGAIASGSAQSGSSSVIETKQAAPKV